MFDYQVKGEEEKATIEDDKEMIEVKTEVEEEFDIEVFIYYYRNNL